MPKIKRPARAGSTHDNQLGARTGDEGMWTLDTLPLRDLKRRFGFEPSPKWIEHVRLASVRFNDGGSGAFVSPNGLVLTNHHVALGQLQKVSTAKKDYVRDGFFARKLREEMRCPDLELNVLVSTQDVTKRVLKTVERDASDKKQNEQRKAEMSRIEKESTEATGFRSDVVELYQGGEYWLYRYKKYTDIRLVMAPEVQAAFFGGDPDNFTYPRYALDFAFFRVYENDKPVPIEHYFKWSKTGPKEGELVFVTGHPGSTSRLRTVRQLEHERDLAFPTFLKSLARRRKAYADYAARGPEQARQAQDRLFGIDNGLKAVGGELEGLQDVRLFERLRDAEDALRRRVAQDKELTKEHGGAWERIAGVQEKLARRHKEMGFRPLRGSRLADLARTIVRYVVEVQKPNEKRYEEFRDSALESLHHRLFSPAPVYPEMEEHVLADVLAEAAEELGSDDKLVKSALGGKSPQRAAHDLIAGTKLADPKFRKRLIDGGGEAVESSKDPLIVWARRLDPMWREIRKWYEDQVQSVEASEGNRIARARFALLGRGTYPDATFTLRLSYGRVAGYELGTTKVPYKTTFYGLFDRAASFDNRPPFNLARTIVRRRDKIRMETPVNFVSTNDIIGGNSGSPVFNRKAEYVGLIFDGNIQGLVWRYAYTDEVARAVAVHSRGIVEALRAIYQMDDLVGELTDKR
ncbi:MAG: hypothetical protein JWN24_937 [Phycisphaerales bacterium]|nr:hypothetical protein [Phycisphaerales bacterium]